MSLSKMRFIATGALVVCVIGMTLCRVLESTVPWLAWPRAFFEAGSVGALADWFAVVVLFRHPLGIPLPHTAIIPKNKNRVAKSLADFIEKSFLSEAQLEPRFRKIDYAGFGARWLREHADMLSEKAVKFAPKILEGISDSEMSDLLAERTRAMIRGAKLAPIAAEGLSLMLQNDRDREIYDSLLKSANALILAHQEAIQSKIQEEIPIPTELLQNIPGLNRTLKPLLEQIKSNLAEAITQKTITKVQGLLAEAAKDPEHSLRKTFDQQIKQFIEALKSSPEMARKVEAMQETIAQSSFVEDFSVKVWTELKQFLLLDCQREDSLVRKKLREAILSLVAQLNENESLHSKINNFLSEKVLENILRMRPHARELILNTIDKWDEKEMADKLEITVGSDLQFIRLNGTLVGGLMGLTIHAIFTLLGH